MSDHPAPAAALSRREMLRLGATGGVLLGGPCLLGPPGTRPTRPVPDLLRRPSGLGAPPVSGLHLTFGDDPTTEMVVSWTTYEPVRAPRVLLGTAADGIGATVHAETRGYTDGTSERQVAVHTATIRGLWPDSDYIYAAVHDGARAEFGTIRTAPAGRARFTFTSFGDMAAPLLTTRDATGGRWGNDAFGTPNSVDVVDGIERVAPLFNLLNGDLCYANLAADRLRTWAGFLDNISRSARHRPWMPAAGNHENEAGNGPIGYSAFQTYFPVPNPGADGEFDGLWYAYTVGNVRFVHLQNDDVCLQDAGNSYVRGYSGGGQRAWLDRELARARDDDSIDWVVVCMHQVAISTAEAFNGADLGIRRSWLPLFDAYGVDLVLCGHEHHYERSHPIRGAEPNATLTPIPAATDTGIVEAGRGAVHLVIGGGGTSIPSNTLLTPDRRCRVITKVSAKSEEGGKRAPTYVWEKAAWSAVRDPSHPYGFVACTVDGSARGARTTIDVTYYAVIGPGAQLSAVDSFTLTKPARRARLLPDG
jgi:3',5'-cyclic AMP phosphodiesterase CpdA